MITEDSDENSLNDNTLNDNKRESNRESNSESSRSLKNIISGVLVTVLGGVILAYIIKDARFSPNYTRAIA